MPNLCSGTWKEHSLIYQSSHNSNWLSWLYSNGCDQLCDHNYPRWRWLFLYSNTGQFLLSKMIGSRTMLCYLLLKPPVCYGGNYAIASLPPESESEGPQPMRHWEHQVLLTIKCALLTAGWMRADSVCIQLRYWSPQRWEEYSKWTIMKTRLQDWQWQYDGKPPGPP